MKTRAQVEAEITRLARTEPGLPDTAADTAADTTLRLLDLALAAGMPLPSDVLGYDPETGPPGVPLEWRRPHWTGRDSILIVTPYKEDDDTWYSFFTHHSAICGTSVCWEEAKVVARFKEWSE